MDRDPAGLEIFHDTFRKLAGDAVEVRKRGMSPRLLVWRNGRESPKKKKKALTGQHRRPVRACLRADEAKKACDCQRNTGSETKTCESAVAPRGRRIQPSPLRCHFACSSSVQGGERARSKEGCSFKRKQGRTTQLSSGRIMAMTPSNWAVVQFMTWSWSPRICRARCRHF